MAKHNLYYEDGVPNLQGLAAAHYELWNWLADNPDKDKPEWPGWEKTGSSDGVYDNTEVFSYCFLCEAMYASYASPCSHCPLNNDALDDCLDSNSLYMQWRRAQSAKDYATAKELALKIRDIWRV